MSNINPNRVPDLLETLVEKDVEGLGPEHVALLLKETERNALFFTQLHRDAVDFSKIYTDQIVHYEAFRNVLEILTVGNNGYPKVRLGRCNYKLDFNQQAELATHFGIKYSTENYIIAFAIPDDPAGEIRFVYQDKPSKT